MTNPLHGFATRLNGRVDITWFNGRKMCCICFEYRAPRELFKDRDGHTWDVCPGECAKEAGLK